MAKTYPYIVDEEMIDNNHNITSMQIYTNYPNINIYKLP